MIIEWAIFLFNIQQITYKNPDQDSSSAKIAWYHLLNLWIVTSL